MMPCSTTVVQDAVNIEVVGSNPTGAVLAGWQSGLMRIFAKDVTIKTVHRFESCSSRLGRLLKWTTRADCKSAGIAFAGSNPASTTKLLVRKDLEQIWRADFDVSACSITT